MCRSDVTLKACGHIEAIRTYHCQDRPTCSPSGRFLFSRKPPAGVTTTAYKDHHCRDCVQRRTKELCISIDYIYKCGHPTENRSSRGWICTREDCKHRHSTHAAKVPLDFPCRFTEPFCTSARVVENSVMLYYTAPGDPIFMLVSEGDVEEDGDGTNGMNGSRRKR